MHPTGKPENSHSPVSGPGSDATELSASLYGRLRRLARRYMAAERRDHTLQPTALVHEALLRLLQSDQAGLESSTDFLARAAVQMRRVLVDSGRARRADKRGGGAIRVSLKDGDLAVGGDQIDVLALHEALQKLGKGSPRQERVFDLRFFSGMKFVEIGQTLGVCERTVRNDWRFARTWLARELFDGRSPGST